MQVLIILLYIACNMQNMQKNMHDMQNMQTSFPICRICTAQFADDHGSPTWFQRLGWLQRHQRPPFHTCALQSKLSIPFWDLPEFAPTSARPWFRRAWWSKVRLTSPSSPTFHEPASLRERQVPEEVVDVSFKALASQWYILGILLFFFSMIHDQN